MVGSRAFGLDTEESDTDRRGIYLPPAELQWSLYGVPEQLENDGNEECYWELQKFLIMALKGNPNILECLYTPLVEHATPLAEELLAMRDAFLSRLVYQTYNGYVMSQFKRMQADLRNQGKVKPKHVMHLIRLLLSGINAQTIDYAQLQRQVDAHPYPLVFATISGAHLYGFPSADSDFDLRGVHLLPLEQVVGLDPGEESVEKEGMHDGIEMDLVTHDAKKFFGLMLKKNQTREER